MKREHQCDIDFRGRNARSRIYSYNTVAVVVVVDHARIDVLLPLLTLVISTDTAIFLECEETSRIGRGTSIARNRLSHKKRILTPFPFFFPSLRFFSLSP